MDICWVRVPILHGAPWQLALLATLERQFFLQPAPEALQRERLSLYRGGQTMYDDIQAVLSEE